MSRILFASFALSALLFGGCSEDDADPTPSTDSGADVVTDTGADSAADSATDSAADSAAEAASDSGLAAACVASGGTVGSALCCTSASDFPNTCSVGACGCAPASSHTVQTCTCPTGKCWDGSTCS